MSESFDVIVVGARCAGAPLATMLARDGLRVCLVDKDSFLSDTPSTHGIQPTDSGLTLIGVCPSIERRDEVRADREAVYEAGLRAWPELHAGMDGARRDGPVRTMANMRGFFRPSAGPGWALVGDAGHFKDPTPGQGIADALRQSEKLAAAIKRALGGGPGKADQILRDWWRWRDEDAWEVYWFAHDMGAAGPTPPVRREAQRQIAADPELTTAMVRVLNHELRPSEAFTSAFSVTTMAQALHHGRGHRQEIMRRRGRSRSTNSGGGAWRAEQREGTEPSPRRSTNQGGRMTEKKPGPGQLITGAGGVLLIVSLFLPWAGAGDTDRTGFELLTIGDVLLLIVGLVAIAEALTWGRYGLFRPDLSVNGAADLLGLVATILLAWLILFDFPSGASREVGVFLALVATIAIAGGAGDYSTLRGAPLFPRVNTGKRRTSS
jgi:hypothetical protein